MSESALGRLTAAAAAAFDHRRARRLLQEGRGANEAEGASGQLEGRRRAALEMLDARWAERPSRAAEVIFPQGRPRFDPRLFPDGRPTRELPERVVLHLGAHKTGSTSLQAMMAVNAGVLARRDIAVVPQYLPFAEGERAGPRGYRSVVRARLTRLARPRHADEQEDRAREIDEIRTSLGPESLGARVLWISDEDLLGRRLPRTRRLYPKARRMLATLKELLPVDDIEVVLYVRELASFVESCYVQHVQMQHPLSAEDALAGIDLDALDWTLVARMLAREVGPSRVTVRRFETIHEGFEAFARTFVSQVTDPAGLDLSPVDANPSLSAIGCELALAMQPLVDAEQWRAIRRFLQRYFSTRSHPRLRLFDDEQRARLRARYEAQLEQLRDTYGPLE